MRSKINNNLFFRKQINSLNHVYQKDVQNINGVLRDFQCLNCKDATIVDVTSPTAAIASESPFKPIGIIRTAFPEKRAVPRQPTVGSKLVGMIEISQEVFTNPEHSLEGLEGFSHMWVIYHFHKNDSHPKAKVAPPRLSGERVGVFSTRSPHRPSPIGLSLVEIDRIDGPRIHFLGTDMIDGTPVLDIKPYIPHYDNPENATTIKEQTLPSEALGSCTQIGSREDPDGEETENTAIGGGAVGGVCSTINSLKSPIVKVPDWILADTGLRVVFNERAERQVAELSVNRVCT